MILLAGIVAAIAVALLRGGSFKYLSNIQIRWAWLALAALTIQVVLIRLLPGWSAGARFLFPLTHLAILTVAWVNRSLRGMWLLAIGVALNLLVMVVNGGFMPVTPEGLVQAGIAGSVESVRLYTRVGYSKSVVMPGDEIALRWLSDTIALRPIQTIVSIGDVLMVPGVFLIVEEAMLQQED